MAAIAAFYRGHTKTKTGIWRDLVVRKRKTEVEAHLGATLERAGRHGLPAPLTRRLLAMIGEIETGRRPMAWANLDDCSPGSDFDFGTFGRRVTGRDVRSQSLTPYWRYRDPREAELLPAVSAEGLMAHTRAFAAWERESGTPGEAQAYDHIERALKSYGYAVERREIEAFISLPLEGRVVLPDGAVIEGLTHAFSPSTDGLDAEVVDVGDGNPGRLRARGRGRQDRALRQPGDAGQGVGRAGGGHGRADLRQPRPPPQHDRDHDLGDARARTPPGGSRAPRACRSAGSTGSAFAS